MVVTGYVYAWDPIAGHATGAPLYTSSTMTLTATGAYQSVLLQPNAAVTAGSDYVAFLFADSGFYGQWAFEFTNGGDATDKFVDYNVGNNFSELTASRWDNPGYYQSAFTADCGSGAVPEPATWALFGAGLIGLALVRRARAL